MPSQKTIKIVYDVNTQSVQVAKQQVTDAKLATDNLIASVKKLGTEGSSAAAPLSSSIAGLTLQMQQLKARIDLANQSDQTRLQGLTAQYREMQAQLDKYNASLNLTTKSSEQASLSIGQMYTAVKLLLTAGLVKEMISAGLAMAELAGKIQGVKLAFDKLPNSVLLMAQLKTATHGMVDELTLMQKALQAKNFGIPLEKLGMLLEFATNRAQQTGISVDYLVDSIVTGLGRNSIKILDNLQINIGELKKRMQDTGKSMQIVAIEMIGDSFKKMDGYVETSETKVGNLKRAWEEFKQVVSGTTGFGSLIDFFGKGVEGLTNAIRGISPDQVTANKEAIKNVENFTAANDKLATSEEKLKAIQVEEDRLRNKRLTDESKLVDIKDKILKLARGSETENEFHWLVQQGVAITEKNKVTDKSIELLKEYERQLRITASIPAPGLTDEEKQKQIDDDIKLRKDMEDRLQADLANNKEWHDDIMKKGQEVIDKLKEFIKTRGDLLSSKEKGATPKGGFVGPDGKVSTGLPPDNGKDLANSLNTFKTYWDELVQGFHNTGQKIDEEDGQRMTARERSVAGAVKQMESMFAQAAKTEINSILDSEVTAYDNRISALKSFYEEKINLAGDNSEAVKQLQKKENVEVAKLERERADTAKRVALMKIVIDTSLAIIQAYAEYPWFVATPIAVGLTAIGAAQYDAANNAKYAKGKININGPGTETSDSIPAMLSKGESVMTAEETRNSMGILQAIRSRKLDDDLIQSLVAKNGGSQVNAFSDKGIIAAINSQEKQDLVKIGSLVFESKTTQAGQKKYIRSKYLS